MSRSPTYANLHDWIVGRIRRHPSSQCSMPAHMLLSPPKYLCATEADAIAALRDLRDAGAIAAHSQRWYLRNKIIRKDARR